MISTTTFKLRTILVISMFTSFCFISCSDDDEPSVSITVNEGPSGDIGGDFTGNGGDGSRTFTWSNNLSTADYNADITSSANGIFQIMVEDANGMVVLNETLNGDIEPDTIDGVTNAGEPGEWTVIITLTSFDGDGSYSLSAGN